MAVHKILVVDDSKTELHHLSELLGKRGYAVRTAENGEEALRRPGVLALGRAKNLDHAESSPTIDPNRRPRKAQMA